MAKEYFGGWIEQNTLSEKELKHKVMILDVEYFLRPIQIMHTKKHARHFGEQKNE